jgi:hypothetical protein
MERRGSGLEVLLVVYRHGQGTSQPLIKAKDKDSAKVAYNRLLSGLQRKLAGIHCKYPKLEVY